MSSTVNFEIVTKECLEGKHKKCKKPTDCACPCHDPDADDEEGEPEDDEY